VGGRATVDGGPGNDRIGTGPYDDLVIGGNGSDSIDTGAGDDVIKVRDKHRDRVRCGPGYDTVIADQFDVLIGCEKKGRTRGARIG